MKAPIVIFAYKRADKLKACIDSLTEAHGHENCEVYIFADGAKDNNDRDSVEAVREYLSELSRFNSFKSLDVIKREKNIGLASNVISGVTEVIQRYGKVIVLEDDLVVSKDYIVYMNEALDYYEQDAEIWSITGFSEPLKSLKKYDHDVYYGYRACSYGWGTWSDRWDTIDWDMTIYNDILYDRTLRKRFERGGSDMTRILKDQKSGIVNSWAIRWCLSQSMQDKYTVYPVHSLVKNTGIDGSGTHQRISGHINENRHVEGTVIRLEKLKPDKHITREFYMAHSNIIVRALRNMNMAGLRKQIKRITSNSFL